MGGVPPRIRVKYRIRAYRPSEGRSPVRVRWMGGMSNSTAPACCHRGRRGSRECAHCTHHHAPRGRGRPRAVAASGRRRAMRRAAACERVTTSIRDGAFATGDIQEQPPRLSQPRPPFPACFQVTHRKIFLFSAVFRLRSPMFPAYVSATNTHPPRILDEDSPPQPQAAISDDARRHTCPCKPFYWVIHGVPPRIRYTFYSDSCLQAVEKPFSGSRAPRHAVNGSTGAFRECTQCEHVPRGQRAPCAGMAACELGWLAHGSRPACATTRRGIRNGEHEGATAAPPETPPTFPCLLSGDTLKNISFSVVFHDG